MKTLLAALSMLALSGAMPAAAHGRIPPVQLSMVLAGTITVDPQGAVRSYAVDKSTSLPAPVLQLLTKNVPHWRFKPVLSNGHPVAAKSAMHLRIVATPSDENHFTIDIAGEWFGDGASRNGFSYKDRRPPSYPESALQDRVSGTVYVVAHIDRQGRVDKVAAEQVDLRVRGPEFAMKRWRKVLADASTRAVSRWTFNVPAAGAAVRQDDWVVRIPINYTMRRFGAPRPSRYGTWTAYIPGPREKVPWLKPKAFGHGSADALPDNGLYLARQSLQLIDAPSS